MYSVTVCNFEITQLYSLFFVIFSSIFFFFSLFRATFQIKTPSLGCQLTQHSLAVGTEVLDIVGYRAAERFGARTAPGEAQLATECCRSSSLLDTASVHHGGIHDVPSAEGQRDCVVQR